MLDSLIREDEDVDGPVGDRCVRISARNTESAFPRLGMNASTSNDTLLRSVVKDTKTILLLEIYNQN